MKITVNNTQLHCNPRGQGAPLLVMHGGLGLDHAYLLPHLARLEQRRRVIYYDHRGNGQSEAPADWREVTFDALTADADALRAQVIGGKTTLFGHSFGGFIALHYALRYADNLTGLVLCSTASNLADHAPVMPASMTPEQQAAFAAIFSAPVKSDADWRRRWTSVLPMYFHADAGDAIAAMDAATAYRAAAWNRGREMLADYNLKARLREIQTPVLIMAGRHDFILQPGYAEDLHRALPNAKLVMFENSGHFPFIEEPGKFINTLGDWPA